jgi:hypothetical protein
VSRWWNELVAALGDLVPGGVPVIGVILFLVTAIVAVLWYLWPAWSPSRWRRADRSGSRRTGRGRKFRWRRLGPLRFRWRRPWWRRRKPVTEVRPDLPDDQVPDVPAAVLALSADELAAAGRYAEAVRERLRAIIRDLIERGVVSSHPGWTVTELARAAGLARPPAAAPLGAASNVFSEIWYGLRPATVEDDLAMREHGERVRAALDPLDAPDPTTVVPR